MPRGPHCGAYYSNCAVIGHFTCQTAYVTGSGGMSYCNQTLLLREGGVWAWDYIQKGWMYTTETKMVYTYSTICMFFMLPSFLGYGRSLAVDFLMMTTVMIVRYLCGVTWWCWDTHWPQYENQPTPVVSQATPSLFLSANCLLILEVISTEEQKQSDLWDYISRRNTNISELCKVPTGVCTNTEMTEWLVQGLVIYDAFLLRL